MLQLFWFQRQIVVPDRLWCYQSEFRAKCRHVTLLFIKVLEEMPRYPYTGEIDFSVNHTRKRPSIWCEFCRVLNQLANLWLPLYLYLFPACCTPLSLHSCWLLLSCSLASPSSPCQDMFVCFLFTLKVCPDFSALKNPYFSLTASSVLPHLQSCITSDLPVSIPSNSSYSWFFSPSLVLTLFTIFLEINSPLGVYIFVF